MGKRESKCSHYAKNVKLMVTLASDNSCQVFESVYVRTELLGGGSGVVGAAGG